MPELSDEQKKQLKNCFEVIKQYQEKHPNKTKFEKKRIIEKENTKPKSNLNSRYS